jgi:hypothetical protein
MTKDSAIILKHYLLPGLCEEIKSIVDQIVERDSSVDVWRELG